MNKTKDIQFNVPSVCWHLLLTLFMVFFSHFLTSNAFAVAYQHEFQIDFSFDTAAIPDKTVTGYRLYKENNLVCETSPVIPQTFTCSDSGETGTYSFTLSALYNDGTESPQSAPFSFTVAGEPAESLPPPTPTGDTAFSFSWELKAGTDAVAYRFYLNDQKLCDSTTPSATSITCSANLLNTLMIFSMASVDSYGVESPKSNILTLNPADYPELFSKKAATFSWNYAAGTNLTGFKIYQNDIFICETSDPTAQQLTCDITLADTNEFQISAIDSGGIESTVSNSIVYVKEIPTSETSTDVLAAVVTASNQTGQAPFTLSLDGSQSTGAISSYTWSFGDGETATGATTSHTYQVAGTYTVSLVVTGINGLTQQSSVAINVSAPPAPLPSIEPTAVISSSSAVGEAPFTVQFDGSGTTTAQPPIMSYSWAFGDGASATGTAVAHTFTSAGTYETTLTVTDSVGLTSQTSTPVLISAPPEVVNKEPIASFTAAPTTGKAPLNVSLNASSSSDPDGTISSYVWSFGDGSSANGISAQHTYSEIADYTITLQVTDDKGETALTSQTISVLAEDKPTIDFELQEVQADHNWKAVTFSKPFTNPVVVAGPPTFVDAQPATLRIQNVTPTGCEIRIQEWNYLDGSHAPETFGLLVMEKGVFTLDNGTKLEAGTFVGSTSFQKVSLQQPYSLTPVILTQVLTYNEADAVTGRLSNSSVSSFEYKMQEQDSSTVSHKAETIGYIAWEPGKGEYAGLLYESGLTAKSVTHSWVDLAFQNTFSDPPIFIASMQTSEETDTAALRSQNISTISTQIRIEEEQSKDVETTHAAEVVGYLAIGSITKDPDVASEQPSASDKQFTFTWDYGDTQNISGFRFYLNNTLLCETTSPTDKQLTCFAPLLSVNMEFSMTAVFLDSSESTPSDILSLSPDDYPDLFGIRLITYSWEFDSSKESSIAGFRVYNNENPVCEVSDPSKREISCVTQTFVASNTFTIKALELPDAESSPSNSLQFSP